MNTALVRVTTNSVAGEFDNRFDDGIALGKNSSIALQNISFMTNPTQLIIDGQNDDITFNVSINTSYTFKLDNATYTFSNYQTLLDEISSKMNAVMEFIGTSIGYTWDLSLNKDNKIEIAFRKMDSAAVIKTGWPYFDKLILNNATVEEASDYWYRSGGVVGSKDSFVSCDIPIARATGYNMGRIRNLPVNADPGSGAAENVGLVFGLTTVKPSTLSSMSFSNIKYGIYAGKQGEDYYTITNGVKSGTAQAIGYFAGNDTKNDYVSIRVNKGNIEYCVTPNGTAVNSPIIINTEVYDNTVDLYPVLVFISRGKTGTGPGSAALAAVTYYRIGLNEFKAQSTNITNQETISLPLGATGPPGGNFTKENHSLTFESISLAEFLGFSSVNQPPNLIPLSLRESGSFIAQNEFKITASSDNYIVELESYPLNSYDGYDSKRRSIIATIPQDDSASNVIQYTPPYPTYINFRNKNYENTIYNLRLRLLDKDLTPVSTVGLSSVTLIFKSDPL